MQGRKEDGRGEILISEDGLSAQCVLYPSIGEGNKLTPDYIKLLIEQAGITAEVDWETVKSMINTAESVKKRQEFIIAKGKPSIHKIPQHLKLKKRFFMAATESGSNLEEEGGRVDYRSYTPYTVVVKNEPIARIADEYPGVPGVSVTGEVIPPITMEVVEFKPGENLVLGEDKRYRAAIDGHFICKDKTFSVSHSLVIQGDIDLHTGHIQFPGNIKASGGVKRGFKVFVTGSFSCAQTIEASAITVGGNLDTAEGIIGYGLPGVKIGGKLQAKFLENAYVECRSTVGIKDSIFNSDVFTLDVVELGNEGKIVGGQIHAVNGIKSHIIGNEMGLYGELHAGQNFVRTRELTKLRQKIVRLGLKKETLKQLEAMGRDVGDKIQEVDELIEELQLRIVEGQQAIDKNRKATIEVTGTIFPGILVSICSATMYIKEKMSNTVFYLEENRIQTISL